MTGSPFRERQLPPDEVLRITRRAIELALIEAKNAGESMTEAELVERLNALGIPPEVARRAMEAPAPDRVAAADGALRVVREVVLEGMLPAERHEEIADAIALAMQMPGRVSVVDDVVGQLASAPRSRASRARTCASRLPPSRARTQSTPRESKRVTLCASVCS